MIVGYAIHFDRMDRVAFLHMSFCDLAKIRLSYNCLGERLGVICNMTCCCRIMCGKI